MADSPRLNLVCPVRYAWAYNPIKLNQAYSALVLSGKISRETKLDPKDEDVAELIKEEYINRKGLLSAQQKVNINKKRSRNTSNVDKLDQETE